ncbi:MAG: flavin oxidoreductase, partial [Dolichospermum sp.]
MSIPDSFSNVVESAKNWVSQVFLSQQVSMNDSRPRDVQILPIGTNTKVLRARSKSRLRFEIE